jgi:hypothetical protein
MHIQLKIDARNLRVYFKPSYIHAITQNACSRQIRTIHSVGQKFIQKQTNMHANKLKLTRCLQDNVQIRSMMTGTTIVDKIVATHI